MTYVVFEVLRRYCVDGYDSKRSMQRPCDSLSKIYSIIEAVNSVRLRVSAGHLHICSGSEIRRHSCAIVCRSLILPGETLRLSLAQSVA